MLKLKKFSCGYGSMQVVNQLEMEVGKSCVMAVLGANGAGKSSLIMALAGNVEIKKGSIEYDDHDITLFSPMERVKKGIAVVPEGRRLFKSLTVYENLIVGGYTTSRKTSCQNIEKVLSIFPRLSERIKQKAGYLSGGEQQMLAIGRALMADPKLLLVDELSLGLMPKAVDTCYEVIKNLNESGLTIMLVEQSTKRALQVSDSVVVLESGNTVWQGSSKDARDSSDFIDSILGLQ